MLSTSWSGACRCGDVRFEIHSAPRLTMACHCTGCQRMTGSAFSLSALFPAESFRLRAGEPVTGGLRGPTRHYFCPGCMSWLFTRPEGLDEFVNVRSTLLADAESLHPFIETWTSEKLSWASTAARHSFETLPDEASYLDLLSAFADQLCPGDGRPSI